jgi:hypothetical protein
MSEGSAVNQGGRAPWKNSEAMAVLTAEGFVRASLRMEDGRAVWRMERTEMLRLRVSGLW